jgi:hypothetical protein
MAKPDHALWLTEQEAAQKLRVSQRQVQAWVKAGQVQIAKRKSGGKTVTIYNPVDVQSIGDARDPLSGPPPSHIYIPNTFPENHKHHTFCKLLTTVDPYARFGLGFEGRLLWPGARLAAEQLGRRPVVLEYAGPHGTRKPRQFMWILWRYDWKRREWVELARTTAHDWTWAIALRPVAVRELAAPLLLNVIPDVRGRALAGELLTETDTRLAREPLELQTAALNAMYDGIAGRLAHIERERSRAAECATARGPGRAESSEGSDQHGEGAEAG